MKIDQVLKERHHRHQNIQEKRIITKNDKFTSHVSYQWYKVKDTKNVKIFKKRRLLHRVDKFISHISCFVK